MIEKKSGAFSPEKFQNHYGNALTQLVQDKMKGHRIIAPQQEAGPKGATVIDLMEALRKSVGDGPERKKPASPRAQRRKRA